jgi:anti-sigma factor RsiW
MMDCDFTEKISLLVDGELMPHEAARLSAHVGGCAACQEARGAFLLLRQELRSYEWTHDAHAQSKALASILVDRTFGRNAAAPSAGEHGRRLPTPREVVRRLSERVAEASGGRRLRPALVMTLAMLLIGTALGLRWLMVSRTPPGTRQSDAPAVASMNGRPVQAAAVAATGATSVEGFDAGDGSADHRATTRKTLRTAGATPNPRGGREQARGRRGGYLTGHERAEDLRRDSRPDLASVGSHALSPSAATDPAPGIGRHAERVERLLRSFRNARLTESESTLDVADARRLSKHLLYTNITLRREAAGVGDLPVEGWLDSLEPILLDISNLPDDPSPDAVGSIKERIRRRQLVGILQAQGMLAARP